MNLPNEPRQSPRRGDPAGATVRSPAQAMTRPANNVASARRALTDSALALVAACLAVAMFLPPLLEATIGSLARTVLSGLAVAVALGVHWVMLGLGVHRMGRPVPGWVALSVLLFPVGGAAALVLLGWLLHEPDAPTGPPAPAH